LFGRLKTQG